MITSGDLDDLKPLEYKSFVELVHGKLVGDKGYIGKNLFERLFVDEIQLITKLKSNMKGSLIPFSDKLLLRKRVIIETVNDELENKHRWNIQGIEPLITLSATFFLVLRHIAAFLRSRVSMFHERLIHSLHCSEFVELTLIYNHILSYIIFDEI